MQVVASEAQHSRAPLSMLATESESDVSLLSRLGHAGAVRASRRKQSPVRVSPRTSRSMRLFKMP